MQEKFDFILEKMNNELLLNDKDYVIIGVSGGSDSMSLLHLLIRLRTIKHFHIVCAHVHHNVRKESDDELIFVRNYCIKNDVIFESMKINQQINGNFENEARKIRYNFFEELIKKYDSKYLFTAHHGDDLIETILMRIVRGSNIKGYSGFLEYTNNRGYKIVRPLIYVTKSQIVEYDKKNGIKWVEDYTNNQDDHTRNRYRKYILPRLKEEDINVNEKFLKFSNNMNDCYLYIDKQVNEILKRIYINKEMNISEFHKYDNFLQHQILYKILNQIYKDKIYLISEKHINILCEMLNSDCSNLKITLPDNYVAKKNYNFLIIEKEKNVSEYCYEFDNNIILPNGKKIIKILECDSNSNYICKLNSKDLKLPLIIRSKRNGDFIYVKNLNGSKKVKNIFIDEKINVDDRKTWPIVTDSNNNVVWIPGVKKSKYDKQNEEKYDIILKYL